MEGYQLIHYLWATAHYLVLNKGYQLVQVQKRADEAVDPLSNPVIHLVKRTGNEFKYIRLALVDYVWSSVIERSVKETVAMAELFRKRLRVPRLEGLSLYFFMNAPMPEVQGRLEELGKVRIKDTTFLQSFSIDLENQRIYGEHVDLSPFEFSREELSSILREEPREPERYMEDLFATEQKRNWEVKQFFSWSRPIWTYILLGLNLLLFLLMTLSGGSTDSDVLIRFGAKQNALIVDGEWWRLLTAMFLHIGFMHLAFNSMALYVLGTTVERMYGPFRFLLIYLVSGLFGSVLSFVFNPHLSAGASGAIYGLFGALLYFGTKRRDLFFRTFGRDILIILGLNLLLTIVVPSIDLYGHLGGLVGGYLMSMAVGLPQFRPKLFRQVILAALIAGLLAAGWYLGMVKNETGFRIYRAEQLLYQERNYPEAERLLKELVREAEENREILYLNLAIAQLYQDKVEEGKESLQAALEFRPDFPEALLIQAQVALYQQRYDEAERIIRQILENDPEHEDARRLYEQIKQRPVD